MQIFEKGDFISCEDENRIFHVLIEDRGRIVFTGDEVPDQYRGIRERISMKGRCVVPAFGDTHMHFASFAFFQATLDVRDIRNFHQLAQIITSYEKNRHKGKIILGFGCSAHTVEEKRLPDRELLDRITRTPLMLVKYDGHAAVANSALIDRLPKHVTNLPRFDPSSGWFYQQAFYEIANCATKSVSVFGLLKNIIKGSDHLARQGIGFVHATEGVGFPLDMDVDLMRFTVKGLPLDFRIYFQTMDVQKVIRRKLQRIGGCFATALDGCFGSEDAALLRPYSNNASNKGILFYTQNRVSDFVKEANRMGLQVAMHAIGDAAIEQAISAYEEALADFPRRDHRHIIIHGELMTPELMERAAKLNLHIAVQTPFLIWDQESMSYLYSILGDRVGQLLPIKSMMECGLILGNGSDAPCTLPAPIDGIYAACNHPNPDQRISVLDALRMHTLWAARLSFDDDRKGSLTEGKNADFAILDRNLLHVMPEKLREVQVTGLYLKGKPYMPVKFLSDLVWKMITR
jgi:hypothetical protein